MNRGRSLVVAAAACALAAGVILAAQQPRDAVSAPNGTAVISGMVVMADAGQSPARRVRVTLNEISRRSPGQTTTTDDAGAFRFGGVPEGRYEIEAWRNGYLRVSYGATRPDRAGTPVVVRAGETVSGLMLTMAKGGVIAGTLRDRQGRPVPDVTMRVLRLGYSDTTGEPTLSAPSGSFVAPTDDRGQYRAFGLPPGGYIVMASPGPGPGQRGAGEAARPLTAADVQRAIQMARSAGPAPPVLAARASTPVVGYAPIFHPDVTDISRATTVTIGAGEERTDIDLAVEMVPTSSISGRVSTPNGPPPAGLQISVSPKGASAAMLAGAGLRAVVSTIMRPDGTFSLGAVPAGSYVLRASGGRGSSGEPTMSAAVDISVTPGGDLDVPITLAPGVTINGRATFDGQTPTPAELLALTFRLLPVGGGAVLYTGGGRNQGPASAGGRVEQDGRFTLPTIPPDTYYLQWTWTAPEAAHRWSATRVTANGVDVFAVPLQVRPGDPIALSVSFTEKPPVLRGVFQDRNGRAATDYYVLIFSENPADWSAGSRRIGTTRPATDGGFEIRGLPPGNYLLGAVTELEPGESRDPALLAQLSKFAIRVTLREGETTTQDIRVGG